MLLGRKKPDAAKPGDGGRGRQHRQLFRKTSGLTEEEEVVVVGKQPRKEESKQVGWMIGYSVNLRSTYRQVCTVQYVTCNTNVRAI